MSPTMDEDDMSETQSYISFYIIVYQLYIDVRRRGTPRWSRRKTAVG